MKNEKEVVADKRQEISTKSIEYNALQKFYPINF